jgi:hypothetical protein
MAIDLSSAFVSYADTNYGHPGTNKWDKMKVMAALRWKIDALSERTDKANELNRLPERSRDRTETAMILNNLLSMIDQTKKDLKMSGWIHMPKTTEEYVYYRLMCGNYEAYAHMMIGMNFPFTEEDKNVAIGHFKKARAIYSLLDMKVDAQHMDTTILMLTSNRQATNHQSVVTSSMLQFIKNDYEQYLNTQGINSDNTITSGLFYAKLLHDEGHLEAERLATKLAMISRQVHGPHHKTTIDADEILKECKERPVSVLPDDKPFQALRYENGGEICVVTGPITKPRRKDDERMYYIANNLVIPSKGCVVICHGLVSASHLNGELGEVRDVKKSGTGIRLAVHFENKGMKSALVKPENLRIAFELPSEENEVRN